ncbi:uncharacterized protein LOC126315261 [Schistocerca gregaria]|uniref:uncharacterized protein LOC126315261 n=1 Tax=Schistocerca gregaria TaxID=7010 RepID=UPI00211E3E13|nr:uncharacterized protein LOC126315261 [Schistocerca gregaria]
MLSECYDQSFGYDKLVQRVSQIESQAAIFHSYCHEKQRLRRSNAELAQELDYVINKIVSCQLDHIGHCPSLQNSPELKRVLTEEPPLPEKSVTPSTLNNAEWVQQRQELRNRIEQLEMRVNELQQYQRAIVSISGFDLLAMSDTSATFKFVLPSQSEFPELYIEWDQKQKLTRISLNFSNTADKNPSDFPSIDDIIRLVIANQSLTFLFREAARRFACFYQLKSQLQSLEQVIKQKGRLRIQWKTRESRLIVYMDDFNCTATIQVPIECLAPIRLLSFKRNDKDVVTDQLCFDFIRPSQQGRCHDLEQIIDRFLICAVNEQ